MTAVPTLKAMWKAAVIFARSGCQLCMCPAITFQERQDEDDGRPRG